jgi:hypothetical protein
LHAIAAIVFGKIAGLVRGAHGVVDRRLMIGQAEHANACVDREYLAFPGEALFRYALADRFRQGHRIGSRAASQ